MHENTVKTPSRTNHTQSWPTQSAVPVEALSVAVQSQHPDVRDAPDFCDEPLDSSTVYDMVSGKEPMHRWVDDALHMAH